MFASAGVVFQGLLRNPLATPFTLGVSSGAALGAVLAITFNWSLAAIGVPAVPAAAFAGSIVAVFIVYALAQARHRGLSTTVLLLAGVTMNAFFSAMILFVQYFASFADTYRTLRWLMGDLDVSSYDPIVAALPTSLAAFAVFGWLARPLNLLALGADSAESRGLDVRRAQRAAFFSASLATGAAVSIGGPIGFVGIIIPHLVRLLVGPRPPARAARGGALRRGVPGRLRPRRPHDPRADRASRRHHHRIDRRPVLPMAARTQALIAVLLLVAGVGGPAEPGHDWPVHAGCQVPCAGGANGAPRFAPQAPPAWQSFRGRRARSGAVRDRTRLGASHPVEESRSTGPAEPGHDPAAQRIISLVPAATEMLYAIGAGPRVVAVSSYDTYPPAVKALPSVGALLDPNLERILSLKPDLVIVYDSQSGLKEQLARAGIAFFDYRHGGLSDVTATIRPWEPARATRRPPRRWRARSTRGLDDIRRRVAGRPRPRTLLVFGRERLALRGIYASGGVGFLNDMLEAAGGTNVLADIRMQAVQASTEQILARRPDVILETRAANSAFPMGERAPSSASGSASRRSRRWRTDA